MLINKQANPKATQTIPAKLPRENNALTHGVYASKAVLLAWESVEDQKQRLEQLWAEWEPEGRMMEESVSSLSWALLQKDRVRRSYQLEFDRDPYAAELKNCGAKSLEEFQEYFGAEAKRSSSLIDDVKAVLKKMGELSESLKNEMRADRPEIGEDVQSVKFLEKMFLEHLLPRLDKENISSSGTAAKTFERAYDPDRLERIVRLETMIDARIDKILARLVSLKEYKRLAAPDKQKVVLESPPIVPPAPDIRD